MKYFFLLLLPIVFWATTSCGADNGKDSDQITNPKLTIIPIRPSPPDTVVNDEKCLPALQRNIVAFGMNLEAGDFDDGYAYLHASHVPKDELSFLEPYPIEYDAKYEDDLCALADGKDNIEYGYATASFGKDDRASFVYRYKSLFDRGFYCLIFEHESKGAMKQICLDNIAQNF